MKLDRTVLAAVAAVAVLALPQAASAGGGGCAYDLKSSSAATGTDSLVNLLPSGQQSAIKEQKEKKL